MQRVCLQAEVAAAESAEPPADTDTDAASTDAAKAVSTALAAPRRSSLIALPEAQRAEVGFVLLAYLVLGVKGQVTT